MSLRHVATPIAHARAETAWAANRAFIGASWGWSAVRRSEVHGSRTSSGTAPTPERSCRSVGGFFKRHLTAGGWRIAAMDFTGVSVTESRSTPALASMSSPTRRSGMAGTRGRSRAASGPRRSSRDQRPASRRPTQPMGVALRDVAPEERDPVRQDRTGAHHREHHRAESHSQVAPVELEGCCLALFGLDRACLCTDHGFG
jgi:hypothetical protein